MIQLLAKVLRILNAETDPSQISLAVCLAMVSGFTPLMSLHNILVLLLVLIMRVNLSIFIVSWALLTGIAYLLDPLFHATGLALLSADTLERLWVALYNIPVFRIERFYNTVTMGSLAVSVLLFLPMYFLSNSLVIHYRSQVLSWVNKSKIMQVIKLNKLYKAYNSLNTLRDVS